MRPNAGLNILLIEDDDALAGMYRLKLAAEGHRVQIASNGHAGLLAALAHPPQLLLLDIRIPGIDGLTLLAALRDDRRCAALPVIVLSDFEGPEIVESGRKLGALAHLVKSRTTLASLVEIVAELQLSRQAEPAAD